MIRALHSEGEALGRFEIRRGRCALARLIGWLCRFPPDGHGVLVQLRVRREAGGLLWQRRFGGVLVETRQDPVLLHWSTAPTAFSGVEYDVPVWLTWALLAMALGVFGSGLRDAYAALGLPGAGFPWDR